MTTKRLESLGSREIDPAIVCFQVPLSMSLQYTKCTHFSKFFQPIFTLSHQLKICISSSKQQSPNDTHGRFVINTSSSQVIYLIIDLRSKEVTYPIVSVYQYYKSREVVIYMLRYCSALLYCCCDKHYDQKENVEEKLYFSLQVIIYHQRKARQQIKIGTQKQELKQRPWKNVAYLLVTMACFLIQLRIICPGMTKPTVGIIIQYQLSIKKMIPQTCPSCRDYFSVMFSLTRCVKLIIMIIYNRCIQALLET